MLQRKTDKLELEDGALLINGAPAITMLPARGQLVIVDPTDWNKFRVSQINHHLRETFGVPWCLGFRDKDRVIVPIRQNNRAGIMPMYCDGVIAMGREIDVQCADFAGKEFPAGFYGLVAWLSCDLSNTTFRGALFRSVGCFFHSCNLRNVQFINGCQFYPGANFHACTLHNANFGDSTLQDVEFYNCNLRGANFLDAVFTRVKFSGCDLVGATLPQSPLSDTPAITYDEISF